MDENPDSYLNRTNGGAMFSGSDQNILWSLTLAKNLAIYRDTSMVPTRGVTLTSMLKMATSYSGKKYKRTQIDKAIEDLVSFANEAKRQPRVGF